MSLRKTLSLLFRKYPLFRLGLIIFTCAATIGIISFITRETQKSPEIISITPSVGSAGDIMSIHGLYFGDSRGTSGYVEVGGSRLTSGGYLNWSETEIRVILPTNVQDGLVIVGTKHGRSNPGFFANTADIPVQVPPDTQTSLPVIASISPASGSYGTLLSITGTNFGTIRNNGYIKFTANRDDATQATLTSQESSMDFDPQYIAANENNYDYEYWSDSEIRVRIPEGAASGPVSIITEKGTSNTLQVEINLPAGTKKYVARRTYLLQLAEDIENLDSKNPTSVTMRVPRPVVTAEQPMAELTECKPLPVIDDYRNTIIYQIELARTTNRKMRFTQNFVVSVYAVQTEINPARIRGYTEKDRMLYLSATQSDALIKSRDEKAIAKAKEIVGRETNPYRQAKKIYDYMLEHYDLQEKMQKQNNAPLSMLEKKQGDAYDFAVVYTTLLRALGIPALPVSGILVDADLKVQYHWWTEFYVEHFGWIPVDIVLAKGITYKAFKQPENPPSFYFGNLDSQHIAFSRGWNEVKPALTNSKIVQRPKSYAFQSLWEESSAGKVNYSTLWNTPVVLGIY
ncbi:MAG: IPT/TIG domain-containing protein [Treponema sp.]|nr:IPT/TIG domain-containing protein [Treponema sp.]